ncbi:uncharacterized protein LOC130802599 [Amaranthus tricolor]|uniref:uncharacterized protein LOC130802599 n=1 Tax=Amaranthus tricolor TaxID=29722 RepID=UPI0025891D83|nr:uncharacterized protein LOC130802599 [Amaranthus tricolor]
MRFGKRGKLSPKFIGPYEVTEKVGKVPYRLALPNELGKVHDVFHISQLKRYVPDKSHVLDPEPLDLDENLSYVESPIKILDSKVRSMRRKDIKMVKVLWSNQHIQEQTWEIEDSMHEKYPYLFPEGKEWSTIVAIMYKLPIACSFCITCKVLVFGLGVTCDSDMAWV